MERTFRDRPWVIIDGDCAFCSTSTEWLGTRLHADDRPDVRRVPYQFLELADYGLTEERTRRELIWLPAGLGVPPVLVGGADAFAAWLRYAGKPYALAGTALQHPLIQPLARLIYRIVAANRHRLPGGTPACALGPESTLT